MKTTTKLSVPYIEGVDPANTIDTIDKAKADWMDTNLGTYSQGTLASRPVSTPGSPGKSGRLYFATDTAVLYLDTGTEWRELAPPKPQVSVFKSSGGGVQTITPAGGTPAQAVTFDSEDFDDAAMFTPGNGFVTIPEAGRYDCSLHLSMVSDLSPPAGISNAEVVRQSAAGVVQEVLARIAYSFPVTNTYYFTRRVAAFGLGERVAVLLNNDTGENVFVQTRTLGPSGRPGTTLFVGKA